MYKRVELSAYAMVITALMIAGMCGVIIYALKQQDHNPASWILGAMAVSFFLPPFFYMPLGVFIDKENLKIKRPLKVKTIPLSEIVEVRLCPPTMGARRICGSGGWFGWYGWFKENDLGKYFAYYGKASDCFLVILKDGKKYMLGCKDAPEMVEAIKTHILNCDDTDRKI